MLWVTLAAGAGFAVARTLLEHDDAASALPEPLRHYAEQATVRLRDARARVREAIAAGGDEAARAERELTSEYLRRAGREPAPPSTPAAGARVAFERLRRV